MITLTDLNGNSILVNVGDIQRVFVDTRDTTRSINPRKWKKTFIQTDKTWWETVGFHVKESIEEVSEIIAKEKR